MYRKATKNASYDRSKPANIVLEASETNFCATYSESAFTVGFIEKRRRKQMIIPMIESKPLFLELTKEERGEHNNKQRAVETQFCSLHADASEHYVTEKLDGFKIFSDSSFPLIPVFEVFLRTAPPEIVLAPDVEVVAGTIFLPLRRPQRIIWA
ncbi:hypothetical protein BDP27DRAFT_1372713 [Rhodocollybia butyracea]|uniref:Uncharacterized protein n=1 Tax=Rhodocollybia butyracea TaxID=206335 RepID=A0A9P5P888_9AGAR|nr:hypothetical protein BDP27DRAFT_1372713 [Rhodocollybia butyracea]